MIRQLEQEIERIWAHIDHMDDVSKDEIQISDD